MADPEEKVAKKDNRENAGSLFFPLDLYGPENNKSIVFNFFDYQKPNAAEKELKNPKGSIALPIPPQIGQNDSFEYSDFSGGFLARAGGAGSEAMKEAYKTFNAVGGARGTGEAAMDLLKGGGTILGGALTSTAQSLLGDEFNYLSATHFGGRTVNPHVGSLFSQVGLRTYEFSYFFVARNQEESDIIRDIIHRFRWFAHTDASQTFFKHPHVVNFSFTPQRIQDYLFRPNISGITGIGVTYNNSTTPTFFEDTGAPVEIQMSIQIKELVHDTKDTLPFDSSEQTENS